MSVNISIHRVTRVRVSHFNRNNNHSVSLNIFADDRTSNGLTLYGSKDVLESLVAAFGDENTRDYSNTDVAS